MKKTRPIAFKQGHKRQPRETTWTFDGLRNGNEKYTGATLLIGLNNSQVKTLKAVIEHNINLDQKMKGASEPHEVVHVEKYPVSFQWVDHVCHSAALPGSSRVLLHQHQNRRTLVHLFGRPHDTQKLHLNCHQHVPTYLQHWKPALCPVNFKQAWAGVVKRGGLRERSAEALQVMEKSGCLMGSKLSKLQAGNQMRHRWLIHYKLINLHLKNWFDLAITAKLAHINTGWYTEEKLNMMKCRIL